MAQGEFTKEEAQASLEALGWIMEGQSRTKKLEFLGHFNDVFLFLEAAKAAAPTEAEAEAKKKGA